MIISPEIHAAMRIGEQVLGEPFGHVERFSTGRANRVFDYVGRNGARAVIRFIQEPRICKAGVYWSQKLRSMGVPLPKMLAHFISDRSAGWSWQVLERFPGTDLEHAYPKLNKPQKLAILDAVLSAQKIVHTLPEGRGFGYVSTPDEYPYSHWADVITESLERSRRWITEVGAADPACVDRVAELSKHFQDYFASIRPIAFLDDTTTRNVIISDEGTFAGIVDVDEICYGDPLMTPALTHMALLNLGCDTDYTKAWLDRIEATAIQQRAFRFYAAVSCVSFIGELGQQFNQYEKPLIDQAKIKQLLRILDELAGGVI